MRTRHAGPKVPLYVCSTNCNRSISPRSTLHDALEQQFLNRLPEIRQEDNTGVEAKGFLGQSSEP
jgi:hypothetical protein